jgi:hypothetical protein
MANNFSSDANCVALWRFENGALTTDSKGSNTLTASASAPTADTTNKKEGGASADFEKDNSQYYSIADASLSAGFPCKNGTTNRTFSVCVWAKFETTSSNHTFIFKNGYWLRLSSTKVQVCINNGGWQVFEHTAVLVTGRWYHIGMTYEDTGKTYRIRVWDDTAGALAAADKTGTGTGSIVVDTTVVTIGGSTGGGWLFDGLMDEMVVCKDVLTADEIDQIRAGTYGASSSSNSSSSSSSISFSSSSSSFSSSSLSSSSQSSSSSYSFSSSSCSSVAPLVFPTLSKGVDLSIGEDIADAGQLASDPNQGRRLVRAIAYKASHRVRLSVSYMTQADRRTLARFYLTTAAGPVQVWEWTHPKSGQTYLLSFDPETPPIWSREPRQPDKHHAEMTLIEHLADGYLTGVYS